MTRKTIRALTVGCLLCCSLAAGAAEDIRSLSWDDLMPPGWVPQNPLDLLTQDDLAKMADGSPEADALYEKLRQFNLSAPLVEELDGQVVSLPGYIVPVEYDERGVFEFLLVPFVGACIHVPPPPANQIVYVKSKEAYKVSELFEAVEVIGVMSTKPTMSELADAGYTMEARSIERFSTIKRLQ
ncbi:MAG: DUF3299 domain-containing protein [Gammaproteobacteria bacterium]|nr:DUF3299 domain-containing protein [Gammaproteobacteria bacterium]